MACLQQGSGLKLLECECRSAQVIICTDGSQILITDEKNGAVNLRFGSDDTVYGYLIS
jgi:hypothetical protein